jgi:hypothetical protein
MTYWCFFKGKAGNRLPVQYKTWSSVLEPVFRIRICVNADPDPPFYDEADPDPDPGFETKN